MAITKDVNVYILFQVSGNITNTGHSVIFRVEQNPRQQVNLTGGPLSYKYQFEELHIHYGIGNSQGSEHTLNGYAFPAEVIIIYMQYTAKRTFVQSHHAVQDVK